MIVVHVTYRAAGQGVGSGHNPQRYRAFDWPSIPREGDTIEVHPDFAGIAVGRRPPWFLHDGNAMITLSLAAPDCVDGPGHWEESWQQESFDEVFGEWAESYEAAISGGGEAP